MKSSHENALGPNLDLWPCRDIFVSTLFPGGFWKILSLLFYLILFDCIPFLDANCEPRCGSRRANHKLHLSPRAAELDCVSGETTARAFFFFPMHVYEGGLSLFVWFSFARKKNTCAQLVLSLASFTVQ